MRAIVRRARALAEWLVLTLALPLRLARRRRRARDTYPRWSLGGASGGDWPTRRPKVLLATSVGGFVPGAAIEGLLAAALTARGAECHALLCDAALPACLECDRRLFPRPAALAGRGGPARLCSTCFEPAARMYGGLAVTLHRYGSLLEPAERDEARRRSREIPRDRIPEFRLDGLAVGEHALAGALRFFARGDLAGEPAGEAVLRRYLEAAILTARAVERLCRRERYDVAVFHHGIYVPQGIVGEVARRHGMRVVNWNPAYRKQCFIFSHGDTYHHTLMAEPQSVWEDLPWTPRIERRLLEYLRSRWEGTQDWIWFHERPRTDVPAIVRELGLDPTRPIIGLLTNVVWDAQLHYPANAFPSMMDWIVRTVEYFRNRPDLQLVIRVHPAEVRGSVPSRQRVVEQLGRDVPALPPNVFVIPPDSRISTYAIMAECDAALIYGTKTGVELTSVGIPVIVAGEAWIRNKGLTRDAASAAHYFQLLDELPYRTRMDPASVERARKYAYHFFFRRMIPIAATQPVPGWPPFRVATDGPDSVAPGRDPGLDVICRGILDGSPFIFPAERLQETGP
ncbi:MAG TPA: hypothetical protein VFH97_06795, partial [Gemmatimonadales bacterium]|nr:hypothetical protein [Gemmatimonadales bacterium]